jgi:amino acid permease
MGTKTTPVATNGLGLFLNPSVALAGQIFAILAIITSFFGIAISLRQTFEGKASLPVYFSLAAIFGPVIILDLIFNAGGGQAFVRVLNYAGGIGSSLFAGLIPAIIVLQVRNAYRFPFGTGGAYACVIFYGLAILYTLFT